MRNQKIKEKANPEYPKLLPLSKKIHDWYKFHESMGAEIIFRRLEDEYGVVREQPIKAIYQSPLIKFQEVMKLSIKKK